MSFSAIGKVLRRAGLVLCGGVLAAALAEVALRVLTTHDAEKSVATIEDLVSRMTEAFGEPNVGVRQQNGNALAFHPLFAFDDAASDKIHDQRWNAFLEFGANEICVFVYGGSVSVQVGQGSPAEIEGLLEADPRAQGKSVRVFPMGRAGFKAPQTLAALQHDLSCGFKPDVVLLLDGFNDLAVANTNVHNQFHPILPCPPFWLPLVAAPMGSSSALADAELTVRREQKWVVRLDRLGDSLQLSRSALASRVWLWATSGSYGRWMRAIEIYEREASAAKNNVVSRGGSFDRTPKAAVELCAQIWEENARSMRAICEARGITFVHVLQPTLHDAGFKPATEAELRNGGASEAWLEGVRIGYPLLRERGARLREQGHNFFDGSPLFAQDTGEVYVDSCHFNERGRIELARFCGRSILALDRPFGARWSQ